MVLRKLDFKTALNDFWIEMYKINMLNTVWDQRCTGIEQFFGRNPS